MDTRAHCFDERQIEYAWRVFRKTPGELAAYLWFRSTVTESGCREWTLGRSAAGYGRVGVLGRFLYAHRVSFEFHIAALSDVAPTVRHRCDNPPCIEPSHLLAGTQLENIADCISAGRFRGANISAEARRVRTEKVLTLRAAGLTQAQIAEQLGITQPVVCKLLRRAG